MYNSFQNTDKNLNVVSVFNSFKISGGHSVFEIVAFQW